MRPDDSGHGFLVTAVAVVSVALAGAFGTAQVRRALAVEDGAVTAGWLSLAAARSTLDEALLDFKARVNRPGSVWFDNLRRTRTTPRGVEWWLSGEHPPRFTREALAGRRDLEVEPVRVSVWRDHPFDPADGPFDEKHGLLTLTADVHRDAPGSSFFGPVVRRQVQRSHSFKQSRIVPPAPFADWTLYVDRLPLLERQREAYDRLLGSLHARRGRIEAFYRREIEEVIKVLRMYIDWMRRKVADFKDTRDLVRRTEDRLHKAEVMVPLSLGLAMPAVVELRRTLSKLREGLRRDIETTLRGFNLRDEATFTRVALNPYPPQNLRRDIDFRLAAGEWPSFRGYSAAPGGLAKDGPDLGLPIVVERARVSTREVDLRLPPPPLLPGRPTYSLRANQIDWTRRYFRITREFVRYKNEYDRGLYALAQAYRAEFQRHEGLFKLVSRPRSLATYLLNFRYQTRRAAYFFDNDRSLAAHLAPAGDVARLDGVYAVRGDLVRLPRAYKGRGLIVVQNDVNLDTISKADPTASLVILAGRHVRVRGTCDVGLMAPRGRIQSSERASTVRYAAVGALALQDDFTVDKDPILSDDGPRGLWVNVTSAPLAEAALRQ